MKKKGETRAELIPEVCLEAIAISCRESKAKTKDEARGEFERKSKWVARHSARPIKFLYLTVRV